MYSNAKDPPQTTALVFRRATWQSSTSSLRAQAPDAQHLRDKAPGRPTQSLLRLPFRDQAQPFSWGVAGQGGPHNSFDLPMLHSFRVC